MNRFPLWKYVLIGITLVVAFLYTLPNFFGEVPAVQVSPVRTSEKVDTGCWCEVVSSLKAALCLNAVELGATASRCALPTPMCRSRPRTCCKTAWANAKSWAQPVSPRRPGCRRSMRAIYLGLDVRAA